MQMRRKSPVIAEGLRATRLPESIEIHMSLDGFGVKALREEAARQRVTVEELASHALTYYLADLDSGRLARKIPPGSDGF